MTEQTAAAPRPAMLVQNRRLGLPERGKIKIGMKGEVRESKGGKSFQPPQKLDHFIITTMERGDDGNFAADTDLMADLAKRTGQEPGHITGIPVRLLWNDLELNFASRYAAYDGRTLFCAGNGVQAMRDSKAIACPCERIEPGYAGPQPCKINGVLSVLIDGVSGVGGVWKFRTTAFNSVDSLTGSLTFIKSITGGQLAGIPLTLTVRPKQVTRPDGKQNTIYVVGVEYRGTVDGLRDEGYAVARRNADAKLSLERAEEEARRLLEAPHNAPLPGDDDSDDVVEEFYPNEAAKPLTPPPITEQQVQQIAQVVKGRAIPHETLKVMLADYGVVTRAQLTAEQAGDLIKKLSEYSGAAEPKPSAATTKETPAAAVTSVPGKPGKASKAFVELHQSLTMALEAGEPAITEWWDANLDAVNQLHEAEQQALNAAASVQQSEGEEAW